VAVRLDGEELRPVAGAGVEGVSDEGHQAKDAAVGAQDLGLAVVIYCDELYRAKAVSAAEFGSGVGADVVNQVGVAEGETSQWWPSWRSVAMGTVRGSPLCLPRVRSSTSGPMGMP
jgi:hypothetical protein